MYRIAFFRPARDENDVDTLIATPSLSDEETLEAAIAAARAFVSSPNRPVGTVGLRIFDIATGQTAHVERFNA